MMKINKRKANVPNVYCMGGGGLKGGDGLFLGIKWLILAVWIG